MSEVRKNPLGRHLGTFFCELAVLTGADNKHFQEIIALLVEAVDDGHSYLPLNEEQHGLVKKLSICSDGAATTPLILQGKKLYFHRYFSYERRLATQLSQLAHPHFSFENLDAVLDLYFPESEKEDQQRLSAELALTKKLAIISGGPGTGKTTTIVKILLVMAELLEEGITIALAAPTGKAAMRLTQSVHLALERLNPASAIRSCIPAEATTIHRLLGPIRHSHRFIHDNLKRLPWDIVVVDEASMVDLSLMAKLVDALRPEARLLLVGDKDQLASVESGAVLADCILSLPENTLFLEKSYRFNVSIKEFADYLKRGKGEEAWRILEGDTHPNLSISSHTSITGSLWKDYEGDMQLIRKGGFLTVADALRASGSYQILCATKSGQRGTEAINELIDNHFRRIHGSNLFWYPGRPVIITRNDYSLDLYNGDMGICLADDDGEMKVWFETAAGEPRAFLPHRLPQFSLAYAITIHKSQGSEFDGVAVVLPDEDNQVLTRELLYTAATRARVSLRFYCNKQCFVSSLEKRILRNSGLADMIAG